MTSDPLGNDGLKLPGTAVEVGLQGASGNDTSNAGDGHAVRLSWSARVGVGSSGEAGYLGKVRVVSYGWGLVRRPDKPWNLQCSLPGYTSKIWECRDEDHARALAERIVQKWLEAAGLA